MKDFDNLPKINQKRLVKRSGEGLSDYMVQLTRVQWTLYIVNSLDYVKLRDY